MTRDVHDGPRGLARTAVYTAVVVYCNMYFLAFSSYQRIPINKLRVYKMMLKSEINQLSLVSRQEYISSIIRLLRRLLT